MKVIEKINYLLLEKKMTKREFANQLLLLTPKLYGTGKAPSESTIYGYLNGGRELKIELVPYIAEVLGVTEQELFSFDIEYASEYNIKYSKEIREIVNLLQYAPKVTIETMRNQLLKYKELCSKTRL